MSLSELDAIYTNLAIALSLILPLGNAIFAQKFKQRTGLLWFFIALLFGGFLSNFFSIKLIETGANEAAVSLGFLLAVVVINAIIFVAIYSLPKKTSN